MHFKCVLNEIATFRFRKGGEHSLPTFPYMESMLLLHSTTCFISLLRIKYQREGKRA